MKQSDLPAGWKSTPSSDSKDDSDAADDAALAQCVGARNTEADDITDVSSPDFSLGNASISSTASGFRSQSDVDSDRAVLKNSKFAGCFKKLIIPELSKSLPAGGKITSTSIKAIPGANGGPTNVVGSLTAVIKVTVNGTAAAIYVSDTFIVGPKIEANVSVENIGSPVSTAIVKNVVEAVAKRTAAA